MLFGPVVKRAKSRKTRHLLVEFVSLFDHLYPLVIPNKNGEGPVSSRVLQTAGAFAYFYPCYCWLQGPDAHRLSEEPLAKDKRLVLYIRERSFLILDHIMMLSASRF